METRETKTVCMLSVDLKRQMSDFRLRLAMQHAGYPDPAAGYPPMASDWGVFRQAPAIRSRVFYGDDSFAYNHHQTITRFKDRYIVSWSSGFRHEDHPGQEVRYSVSDDGLSWGRERVLAPTDPDQSIVRHNAGLYATDTHLYALVGVSDTRGNTRLGMCSMEADRLWIDAYETQDLQSWKHHERIAERVYFFQGPGATQCGRLLCCGTAIDDWQQGLALIWEQGAEPTQSARTIEIPKAPPLEPLQGTWYQTDEGTIWMFLRDGSYSCRLALTWSRDEGETWSEPLMTDFPNTCSRANAGRLTDGRYYLVGNNYDRLLDRRHLQVALSDNGEIFDRMYTVVSGATTRRIEGKHKEDGYHYPNCYPDGNKLLITYSVNKEDIEVTVLDTENL